MRRLAGSAVKTSTVEVASGEKPKRLQEGSGKQGEVAAATKRNAAWLSLFQEAGIALMRCGGETWVADSVDGALGSQGKRDAGDPGVMRFSRFMWVSAAGGAEERERKSNHQ